MHSLMEKFRRPLLAAILLTGLSAGIASAVDYYAPTACQPVCPQPVACAVSVNPCDPCSATTSYAYPASYSYVSQGYANRGTIYLVPTVSGFVETTALPITNDIDMYYATHRVVNGQVVQVNRNFNAL